MKLLGRWILVRELGAVVPSPASTLQAEYGVEAGRVGVEAVVGARLGK